MYPATFAFPHHRQLDGLWGFASTFVVDCPPAAAAGSCRCCPNRIAWRLLSPRPWAAPAVAAVRVISGPGLEGENGPSELATLPTLCCPRPWTTVAVTAVRALSGPILEPNVPWGLATLLVEEEFFAREFPIPVGLPLAPT